MLKIVKATPLDIPFLFEKEQLCFGAEAWSENVWQATFLYDFNFIYLLYLNQTKIGYFCISQFDDELHIMNIAVIEEFRGCGYSKKMLEFILDTASCDVTLFTLEVREDNLIAINLYESFGFKVVGRRPKYYDGGVAALIMSKNR